MTALPRFHLAFPVDDLKAARYFYAQILGCSIGRESDTWIDFNFMGHQIVAHLSKDDCNRVSTGNVDNHAVPVRHFGLLLDYERFNDVADRLKQAGCNFIIEPYVRFKGQAGEQKTMFLLDPAGNALEFKAFKDDTQIFARSIAEAPVSKIE